jgi:GMP synthase (glutamine-hydrolysing)
MNQRLRYLLLQTRKDVDPMASQEVRCFARSLDCDASAIEVVSLLKWAPSTAMLNQADMILLGGSGEYSAAAEPNETSPPADWLIRALDCLREIHELSRPTFASCWGFQAMARATGGTCVNDLPNAELGTIELELTAEAQVDPIFGSFSGKFFVQAGHEDHVTVLPKDAVLLASSRKVAEQAFRFRGKPIYCTQFHPELDRAAMLERVIAYPAYVERIARLTYDEFVMRVRETPEANSLLRRFVVHVFE